MIDDKVEEPETFECEAEILGKSEKFMDFLWERSEEKGGKSLDEIARKLDGAVQFSGDFIQGLAALFFGSFPKEIHEFFAFAQDFRFTLKCFGLFDFIIYHL